MDIKANILQRLCQSLNIPLIDEDACRTWGRNNVMTTKTAYRGALVYLDGAVFNVPEMRGKGHVGFLTHRNMLRGPITILRDALSAFVTGQEYNFVKDSISRRKPKAEGRSKAPEKKKINPDDAGFYTQLKRAFKADMPNQTANFE